MMKYICLFLIIAGSITAQNTSTTDKIAQLDKFIQSGMSLWKTTGISIAVVKEGNVIFKKGYGYADINTKSPFTTSTISFCASTTKAMTATCMAMLVDEGKVNWNDKLKNVLPDFRLYDPYVTDEITVRDLFTHNAGLGNGDGLWVYGYSSKEIVRRMRYMKPAYSMRSSFIYQNLMYVVAGEVIEKISGKSWHQFINERLFRPLNMNHTYALIDDAKNESSKITPHWWFGDTLVKAIENFNYGGYDPAGSVVSSADDIVQWLKFWQDSGKVNGKRLISAASYEEILKPQSFVTADEFYPTQVKTKPHWMTYGLGWFQQDYRGKMIQYHTGSLDGSIAIHGFIPEEKFSIYLFANLDHSELRHAIMWKAIDLWSFNDNSRDWSTELFTLYKTRRETARKAVKEKEAKRAMDTKPNLPLYQYTGTYNNEIYGRAEIIYNGTILKLVLPNKINADLTHWHYDTFKAKYNYEWFDPGWINFSLNADGKINSMIIDGVNYSRL